MKYSARHGKQPDFSSGIDNVVVADVEQHENQWQKIVQALGSPAAGYGCECVQIQQKRLAWGPGGGNEHPGSSHGRGEIISRDAPNHIYRLLDELGLSGMLICTPIEFLEVNDDAT